jgi:hypothetical protein
VYDDILSLGEKLRDNVVIVLDGEYRDNKMGRHDKNDVSHELTGFLRSREAAQHIIVHCRQSVFSLSTGASLSSSSSSSSCLLLVCASHYASTTVHHLLMIRAARLVNSPLAPLQHDTFASHKSFSVESKESRKEAYQKPKYRKVKIHKRSLIFTLSKNAFLRKTREQQQRLHTESPLSTRLVVRIHVETPEVKSRATFTRKLEMGEAQGLDLHRASIAWRQQHGSEGR